MKGILDACRVHGIRSGLICSCIGSLQEVNFVSIGVDPNVPTGVGLGKEQRFEGPISVLNGQGCIGQMETRGAGSIGGTFARGWRGRVKILRKGGKNEKDESDRFVNLNFGESYNLLFKPKS